MSLQVCYHLRRGVLCISGVKSRARPVLGERKYGLVRGVSSFQGCPYRGVLILRVSLESVLKGGVLILRVSLKRDSVPLYFHQPHSHPLHKGHFGGIDSALYSNVFLLQSVL